METNYKSLAEAMINYTVDTNKQMYEFGTKMVKEYAEFNKSMMKFVPGMEAWEKLIPVVNTNKK